MIRVGVSVAAERAVVVVKRRSQEAKRGPGNVQDRDGAAQLLGAASAKYPSPERLSSRVARNSRV